MKDRILAAACMAAIFIPSHSWAHAVAGNRVFPTTLAIDDPGVSDELSLPTFAYITNADGAREVDLTFEYSKRITERLALSVGSTWTHLKPGGAGFQNLETTLKYMAFVNPEHEFMLSVGLGAEWGGTGAARVGADPFSAYTPQVYFGKGFGDLPPSLNALRPLALTGQFGLAIPGRSSTSTFTVDPVSGDLDVDVERHPKVLNWGFSLQYSLPYLNANVRQIHGPDFLRHLTPLVEVAFQTPVENVPLGGQKTTGTVNPGVIYSAEKWQFGLEAMIPVNSASGKHVGVIGQLHFFLDDIFPNSIGRPIFP